MKRETVDKLYELKRQVYVLLDIPENEYDQYEMSVTLKSAKRLFAEMELAKKPSKPKKPKKEKGSKPGREKKKPKRKEK